MQTGGEAGSPPFPHLSTAERLNAFLPFPFTAGVHELVWVLSFVSFYFLYPSTFNLLEIAAVDRPKLHMWATGVMRITRCVERVKGHMV